jgi:hypothetical protein
MLKRRIAVLMPTGLATTAMAQEPTWRKDVGPMIAARCGTCHDARGPEYDDWNLMTEDKRRTVAPRMDTYPHFMSSVVWPATGAMQRRLDDGKAAGGKPGNRYRYFGGSDEERAKNRNHCPAIARASSMQVSGALPSALLLAMMKAGCPLRMATCARWASVPRVMRSGSSRRSNGA